MGNGLRTIERTANAQLRWPWARVVTLLFFLIAIDCETSANAEKASQQDNPRDIFSSPTIRQLANLKEVAGEITYIVWINGDADHFVTGAGNSRSRLIRADELHADRVFDAARRCHNCNVVTLHIQRGGARWYTGNRHWATFLTVFEKGALRMERSSPIENAADVRTLTGLLRFSDGIFGDTQRHLIYVGHSFEYQSGEEMEGSARAPFAYSFPRDRYGPKEFIRSLEDAHMGSRLSSITFAACSMADIGLAGRLAPFSVYVVAPQFDVLERAPVGFSFDGIRVAAALSSVSSALAEHLMDAFNATQNQNDVILEYPVSEIRTDLAEQVMLELRALLLEFSAVDGELRTRPLDVLRALGQDPRRLSDRYLRMRSESGRDNAGLDEEMSLLLSDADRLDVGKLVEGLGARYSDMEQTLRIQQLLDKLRMAVAIYDGRKSGGHSGLNVDAKEIVQWNW